MDQERTSIKTTDKKTALLKAENFCAYQERSQQEVRDKLYDLGLHKKDVEEIIAELIQNNFLNEARFASAYVSGKFRIKQWGKLKIAEGLKFKRVAPGLISKALSQIDPDEYVSTLHDILEKKSRLLGGAEPYKKKQKLIQYARSRGFETDLIFDALTSSNLI